MSFSRKALTVLPGVTALALPLLVLAPANAYTSSNGCTITPEAPVFDHLNDTGRKVIKYWTNVLCSGDRTVEIQDRRYDDDWTSADDPYGTTTYKITFTEFAAGNPSVTKVLPDADAWGDDNEEMYHSTRFRVTGILDGVTSPWTAWERSPVVTFHR